MFLSIVELQDVFESSTFIFLVFELCKNGELFDYLTSVVTLSEKKTRYIMRQVFEGVAHIHAKSVVHRDLKPENILLDDGFNVKITDFGFARELNPGQQLYGGIVIIVFYQKKVYTYFCRFVWNARLFGSRNIKVQHDGQRARLFIRSGHVG